MKWFNGMYWFVLEPFTGEDDRLSWSKIVVLLVIASYWHNPNLPAIVAISIIVSSYGVKYLMTWLKSKHIGASAFSQPAKEPAVEPGD